MIFSTSTESLLNRIPKFGHTSWGSLESGSTFDKMRKRNTSATSESLKRKSTASKPYEHITPPTTAGTELSGYDSSLPVHFIDAFELQQKRKGSFLNHTPRDFDMRTPKPLEVYRPLPTSEANYSRPRASGRTTSINESHASISPLAYDSSTDSHMADDQIYIHPIAPAELESGMIPVELDSTTAPVELDSKEMESPSSSEEYQPPKTPLQRSYHVPITRTHAHEPRSVIPSGYENRQVSARSPSPPVDCTQDTKRQRRQTPFQVPTPHMTSAARHAPLEPLVAKHMRKASRDTISILPEIETGGTGELGTFGVIQRYFDSQMGGPVLSPKSPCRDHSPCSQEMSLPKPYGSALPESFNEQTEISSLDEMEVHTPPPAVPDRSPRRLTNPEFPLHAKYSMSVDSEYTIGAQRNSWASEKIDLLDKELQVSKTRDTRRHDMGQAGRSGSSQTGRLAPPILSHDALTASADLGLNDLSFYLKNTGPPTDPQPVTRQRQKRTKLFKNKPRPSLADRVGSVEGSPQRVRRQPSIPTCAREMTTSGGARHLKIIIPTESPRSTQIVTIPESYFQSQRRSCHVSLSFNEDQLLPLVGLEAERSMPRPEPTMRSFSEPVAMGQCSLERGGPKTPSAGPLSQHPVSGSFASREEQIRARKLRDLQRIKRKPLPRSYSEAREKHLSTIIDALPTPTRTPEPPLQSSPMDVDGGSDEKEFASDMARLQERIRLLQRQNEELTETLAKIMGLKQENGELDSETVLKAWRQIKFT
ncbi:hypothetical protein TW65_03198 [Stemphylium lycopersici]|uniref:Uncharacterized protein n=1 Tax=Stemphylium lycopersici TaxID=183478 RepID=A0A364NGF3_STELY|nr:hypothetical protein TW65_03198 [Stemphylium lycopersici]RAR16317.1 hypothetical protein DDE83_000189 [Stemphylium lycopersici]